WYSRNGLRVEGEGIMLGKAARVWSLGIAIACTVLVGCGSDSSSATLNESTARGTLIYDPPFRIASLDAATFAAQLTASASGQALLALSGPPACGVDFYHVEYQTV